MLEKYPRWLIAVGVVVFLAFITAIYYTYSAYNANANLKATSVFSRRTSTPTPSATTTAAATSGSISSIKSDISATDVAQIKSTLSGLKSSLSMFNR